jgi:hypothetical protein
MDDWELDKAPVNPNEAELGFIHALRGDGYVIAASELPCVADVVLMIGLAEGQEMSR